VNIQRRRQYLWRAVDQDGDVIDILVQPRPDRRAAERFFRKLLKGACARDPLPDPHGFASSKDPQEDRNETGKMVTLTFASWNRFATWLRQMDDLRSRGLILTALLHQQPRRST